MFVTSASEMGVPFSPACSAEVGQTGLQATGEPSALEKMRLSQRSDENSQGLECLPADTTRSARQKALSITSILVRQTAYDHLWNRVRGAPSPALMQSELQQAGVSAGMSEKEILRLVNTHVNQKVAYKPDDRSYGRRDYWAKPSETLAKQTGDCEDYAVLKMHILRASGYPADKMRVVLARDLAANQDHAFLVVFTPTGSQVLDNNIDRVYSVKEAVALRPIMSFSEGNRWVHGIRDEA